MELRKFRQVVDLFLVFGSYFLSNILAFAYAFWLVPILVLLVLVFWLLITALTVWIMHKQDLIRKFLNDLRKNWILLPFLIFSGFSILWSVHWEISLYRWLTLVSTIIIGGYIGLRYDIREILRFLSVFGVYILLLASILVFFVPGIGIMNYHSIQGAWKGVYWHKNHMGLLSTFINILFLINVIDCWQPRKKDLWLWGSLYIISFWFIYQSDSVAAYLTTISLHGIIFLILFLLKFRGKIRRHHYLIAVVLLLCAAVGLSMNLDQVFGLFNRNTTLTGRIPFWTYLFSAYINKQPLLGYGFNAFWYIPAHQAATQLAAGYPDTIIISDNGFIDILVNTGYGGLILFLLFYFGAWWRSIQYAGKAKDLIGFFPVILMAYTLLANISWSLIFENEGFFMLNMISVIFCISGGTAISRGE